MPELLVHCQTIHSANGLSQAHPTPENMPFNARTYGHELCKGSTLCKNHLYARHCAGNAELCGDTFDGIHVFSNTCTPIVECVAGNFVMGHGCKQNGLLFRTCQVHVLE